jgi:uncharacterized protein YndB with AHSA1/START domain
MTRIYNTIHIDRPVDQVFDYVTTARNWPKWHPSSLRVTGAVDHPAQLGEQVTEEFRVAGRRGRVLWTVRECQAPRKWSITGVVEGGGSGVVTYTLTPHGMSTNFEREFTYPPLNLLYALLDLLILRRRIQAESLQAVQQLKQVLQSSQQDSQRDLKKN